MTRPDRYTTVSHIGSPFEGAMALVAEIIRERPNLPEGLCTGNPVGAIDLVDEARDRGRNSEAHKQLRAMCSACPVREQCPDRADIAPKPRRRAPQGRQPVGGKCRRGHRVEAPNIRGDGQCLACTRARQWGQRRRIPATDPRVTQIAQKQYLDIMKNHLLGGTA